MQILNTKAIRFTECVCITRTFRLTRRNFFFFLEQQSLKFRSVLILHSPMRRWCRAFGWADE